MTSDPDAERLPSPYALMMAEATNDVTGIEQEPAPLFTGQSLYIREPTNPHTPPPRFKC